MHQRAPIHPSEPCSRPTVIWHFEPHRHLLRQKEATRGVHGCGGIGHLHLVRVSVRVSVRVRVRVRVRASVSVRVSVS